MRGLLAVAALVALGGCEKASDREQKRLAIVEKGERDNTLICQQTKKVSEAFLSEGNEESYRTWKLRADIACAHAEDEPYNMEGIDVDNLEASDAEAKAALNEADRLLGNSN